MKQRIITGAAIVLGVLPIFFFEKYFMGLMLMVALIATYELIDLISEKKYPLLMLVIFAQLVTYGFNFVGAEDKLIITAFTLLLLGLINIFNDKLDFKDLSLVYTVALLMGYALNSVLFLYQYDLMLVIYIVLANYGSDIGAYFIGSKFGKNKLAPKISPNKTIEGSIGGIGFGGILGIVFGLVFLDYVSLFMLIIVSFMIPVISQLGDLFFSTLKRLYNKKDFGKIFPGHGGIIDRIDSLIFSLIFMIVVIRLGFLGVLMWLM